MRPPPPLRASIMPARAAVGKRLARRVRYHAARRATLRRRGGEEETMKLALFNDYRLGVVRGDTIVDVTSALPAWDNGYMANFWLRMCKDFDALRPKLEAAAASGQGVPVSQARLNPP